jgi:hypothetical protein
MHADHKEKNRPVTGGFFLYVSCLTISVFIHPAAGYLQDNGKSHYILRRILPY